MDKSKVLTVSYGAFSCTLEGFDDSVDVVKAIADYFRTLTELYPHFGAEPPALDTKALAGIAEREAANPVEAHEEQGQIILRMNKASRLDEMPDEDAGFPAEPDAPSAEHTNAVADNISEEDSVVAKLRRIRSVVSGEHPPAGEDDYSEAEHAQDSLQDAEFAIDEPYETGRDVPAADAATLMPDEPVNPAVDSDDDTDDGRILGEFLAQYQNEDAATAEPDTGDADTVDPGTVERAKVPSEGMDELLNYFTNVTKSGSDETDSAESGAALAKATLLNPDEGNDDISRLFDEADQQREEPESTMRRRAIQHLRTAVAATRAEEHAATRETQRENTTAYRADIPSAMQFRRSESIRPSQPVPSSPKTEPAPLKLAAEQRIDTSHAPLRLRRASAVKQVLQVKDAPPGPRMLHIRITSWILPNARTSPECQTF